MKELIAGLLKNRFFRNNLLVFVGSIGVSAFNYLYYPVMARLMSVGAFGEVQTLVSMLTQAFLIFGALNIVTVILISGSGNNKRNEEFILELQKLALYFAIALGLAALIFSPIIEKFFKFESIWPIWGIALALIMNVPFVFWSSYLQGKEEYAGVNALGLWNAGAKLLFAIGLVLAGFGALGAILGIIAGQLSAMIFVSKKYNLPSIRNLLSSYKINWSILVLELKFTMMVLMVTFGITLLYSGDILMVKHYQNAEVAGAYAGVAAIARIIFFLTLPFATVLLPAVHSDWADRTRVLKRSFALTLGIGSLTCAFFGLFSRQVITAMVGVRYVEYAHLLPKLSLAILLISVANIIIYYLMAVRSIASVAVTGVGVTVFLVSSYLNHASLDNIISDLLLAAMVTIGSLVLVISIWPRLRGKFTKSRLISDLKRQTKV